MAVGDRQPFIGCVVNHNTPPSPLFSQVLILKEVKVLCFDTLFTSVDSKGVSPGADAAPFGGESSVQSAIVENRLERGTR